MKKILILLLLIVSTTTAKDIKYTYTGLVFISSQADTIGLATKTVITISGNTMKIRVPEHKKNQVLNWNFTVTLNEYNGEIRKVHIKNKGHYGAGYFDSERATIVFEDEDYTKYTFIYFKK